MRDANIYMNLWQKYRPVILNKMEQAHKETQEYQLMKHEFESIGDRKSSGYSFNLEISNGIVSNNIGGTAVARDLYEVLKNSDTAKSIMENNHIKITLSKEFVLAIRVTELS